MFLGWYGRLPCNGFTKREGFFQVSAPSVVAHSRHTHYPSVVGDGFGTLRHRRFSRLANEAAPGLEPT